MFRQADRNGQRPQLRVLPLMQRGCAPASMLSLSDTGIHAVLVLRKGTLVFEQYRTARDIPSGKDPGIYTYDAATRHDVRSISKSVVSLLVGIAVDRQMISSVDDRVFDYLPQYADLRTAEKSHITIADLLSMRSQFVANEVVGYEEPNNTERLMNEAARSLSVCPRKKNADLAPAWPGPTTAATRCF